MRRELRAREIYLERGTSLFGDDFELVTTNIAGERFPGGVEAPIVIRHGDEKRWFLFLDRYQEVPQGYFAMECTDLDSGEWAYVSTGEVTDPPSHKARDDPAAHPTGMGAAAALRALARLQLRVLRKLPSPCHGSHSLDKTESSSTLRRSVDCQGSAPLLSPHPRVRWTALSGFDTSSALTLLMEQS